MAAHKMNKKKITCKNIRNNSVFSTKMHIFLVHSTFVCYIILHNNSVYEFMIFFIPIFLFLFGFKTSLNASLFFSL